MNIIKIERGEVQVVLHPDDCQLLHEVCRAALQEIITPDRHKDILIVQAMGSAFQAAGVASAMQVDQI